MLSEKKLKQLSEARKHIQHRPLSEETKQKISKANNGNFFAICDYCGKEYKFLSGEEKQKLMSKIDEDSLSNWPDKNSIQIIDNVIVIKLGD